VTQLHRAVVVVLALAVTATACGSPGQNDTASLKDRIKVNGAFGAKPSIRFRAPLKVPASSSWVGEVGAGDKVGDQATVILELTMANGRTGKTAISTLDAGQRPLEVQLGDQVFRSLAQALVGKPAHSRVVVASTAADAYGENGAPQLDISGGDPVVMVADILATDPTSLLHSPTGTTMATPSTAPRILEKDGVPASLDFAGTRKPKKLVVVPLREGTGPVVASPDRVAVNFLVQVWNGKRPAQETYSKEPTIVSVGTGAGVIKAWDRALVGEKEGARVMIISPPDLGYGKAAQPQIPANSTLVSIIDVLGVG
jgi:peptidylprolyl isomerase